MKKRKVLSGYIIFILCLIISVSITILFGNKGTSLIINLVFAGLMFGIVFLAMKKIRKYIGIVDSLSEGTDYLNSLTKEQASAISDGNSVFRNNEKLAGLLTKYYKENDGYDGEISYYINEELLDDEINKQVMELISGAMTGLGLLGTFIGFMIGIKDLNMDQNELFDSIKTLMDGMKTAFLTSIFGVVYSLIFNWYYKQICSYGRKELNRFYDAFYDKIAYDPENRNVNLIVDYQRRQVEELEKLPNDISLAISERINTALVPAISQLNNILEYNFNQLLGSQHKQVEEIEKLPNYITTSMVEELDKVLSPTISKMDSLMEKFVDVATTNQQESLERLVNSFVDSMNEILNDKFVLLGETLDRTCQLQQSNFEMMENVVTTITTQAAHLSELNESVEKSLENIQEYESKIEMFNKSIITHNNESHKLIAEVLESQNNTHSAVKEFTENISEANSYINNVGNVLNQQKEVIEEFSDRSKEIIDYNASVIAQITSDTAENFNKIHSIAVESVSDVINQQKNVIKELYKTSKENIDYNASTLSKINKETADNFNKIHTITSEAVNNMQGQVEEFKNVSIDLVNEIKTVGSRIRSECSGLEESLGSSLNSTFKVFDSNLAEITTHLNSSIREMQELVDKLPVDIGISISKLRTSMNECVALLNDNADNKGMNNNAENPKKVQK
ncbi:MAG: MotA/TolQ/ExbB proton channel family protein [Ruminococcus sp.]|nr:MotA/TolQ/ExbB proton channel family protein [Ruminococcus sp.]